MHSYAELKALIEKTLELPALNWVQRKSLVRSLRYFADGIPGIKGGNFHLLSLEDYFICVERLWAQEISKEAECFFQETKAWAIENGLIEEQNSD